METGAVGRGERDERRWRAVRARDARADGTFVFAVRTTGVYCRPSCGARRPRRENVRFYRDPDAAERAGFRACRRCHPREASAAEQRGEIVRAACRLLDGAPPGGVPLAELGRRIGYSPWHLHRMFRRATGLTPRQYARARRMETFKRHLKEGRHVLEAMVESGFGSTRGAYEGAGPALGMTPSEYRRGGARARIGVAVAESALGPVLVAATPRGVCRVRFGRSAAALERELVLEFPRAERVPADRRLRAAIRAVLAGIAGRQPDPRIPLDVHATAFQRRVWEALRAIPAGETRSYGEIARAIGRPDAARAVGRACATNPVAVLVPCHRAIRADGARGGYAWGPERKRALLERERRAVSTGRSG